MTFYVPTKLSGHDDDTDHFIDLEAGCRIYIKPTAGLDDTDHRKHKGTHVLIIDLSGDPKENSFVYCYGSQQECENEMKKLIRKLKWRERKQHIIAPGVFIFLGVVVGIAISLIKF